jgi:hypothetical protein
MGRAILFFVIVVILTSISIVYAAPVGNIAKPAVLKSSLLAKELKDQKIGAIIVSIKGRFQNQSRTIP